MARRQNNNRGFEDVSSFSSRSDYRKAKKAKKGGHKVIKGLIVTLCVLLIALGGLTLFAANYLFGDLTTRTITKDKEELGIASGAITHPKITNIALFGVDSRDDSFTGLSDSIIVLSIDQVHSKVKLASILRDCRVYIGDDYTSTGYDKITHAYSYGGPELAIKTLNQNFGLNILDYVTVNFNQMSKIVDAFNGVDIEITEDEADHINRNLGEPISMGQATEADYIPVQGGMTHLNGNQAVAYSRIRYLDSDNIRAERQQKVLTALLEKGKSISALELPGVIKKMSSLCETSLDMGEMVGFIPFVGSGFTIERASVPDLDIEGSASGYFEGDGWMWDLDIDAATQHLESFIYEGDTEYARSSGE